MSVIRQTPPSHTPPARAGGDARAAFFQAAVKGAPALAPTTRAVAQPAPPVVRPQQVREEPQPAPQRYLRPGSLIDIKV